MPIFQHFWKCVHLKCTPGSPLFRIYKYATALKISENISRVNGLCKVYVEDPILPWWSHQRRQKSGLQGRWTQTRLCCWLGASGWRRASAAWRSWCQTACEGRVAGSSSAVSRSDVIAGPRPWVAVVLPCWRRRPHRRAPASLRLSANHIKQIVQLQPISMEKTHPVPLRVGGWVTSNFVPDLSKEFLLLFFLLPFPYYIPSPCPPTSFMSSPFPLHSKPIHFHAPQIHVRDLGERCKHRRRRLSQH